MTNSELCLSLFGTLKVDHIVTKSEMQNGIIDKLKAILDIIKYHEECYLNILSENEKVFLAELKKHISLNGRELKEEWNVI